MTKIVFTICSANHLPFARTLAASVKRVEQDVRFIVFLADVLSPPVQQLAGELEIVPIDRLAIPNLRRMAFRYGILELNTAVKPFCFDYVFDVLGFQAAIYLDADIYVLKALHHVHDALENGASCVLTPHITAPLPFDGAKPDVDTFMQAGMYNLGFLGLGNTLEARAFNTWWGQKTRDDCFVAQDRGVFVDQKFVDFAPSFMNDVLILRHPGYNVAYWNLPQRQVSRAGDRFMVNQAFDLHFFHFSGIDLENKETFSKYQTRFKTSELGRAVNDLYDAYVAEVRSTGSINGAAFSETPYGFGTLRNGLPISQAMRLIYATHEKEIPAQTDPFDLDSGFFDVRSFVTATSSGVAPEELASLLSKALTGRSFMFQNFVRRLLKGKYRVLDYWSRRLRTVAPGGAPQTADTSKKPTRVDFPTGK
jgi:hypothetical protein